MKKKILYLSSVLLMLAFVLIPAPASKLYIRIYFDDITGNHCALYYSVDSADGFSGERKLTSVIDYENKRVEFCIDSSLAGHITGLRLDFPDTEQLLSVRNITVSSAGVIKRAYNPCDFFEEENIAFSNSIDSVTLVKPTGRTYIGTLSDDPYLVLANDLCLQIVSCYSNFRLTRALICLFFIVCFAMARAKAFTAAAPRL